MIEVRGEITEQDFLSAQRLHWASRVGLRAGVTLVMAGYVLLVIVLVVGGLPARDPGALVAALFPLVAIGALVLWSRFRQRRTYRGMRALRGEHRYAISESGLAAESELGKGETSWDAFVRWREGPDMILLYQADNLFHMLPMRWFEGDQARLEEVRELLRSRIR